MQTQITRLVSWYAWIMIAENNNRILVIDGNATTRGRIREILQKAGFWRVDEAPTARDALQLLNFPVLGGIHAHATSDGNGYDLVLLRTTLPDFNGVDLCRRVKAKISTTLPIILITQPDALDEQLNGIDAGADDFMTEHIHRRELLAWTNNLLRRK